MDPCSLGNILIPIALFSSVGWQGRLVYYRVTTCIKLAGIHLYIWLERGLEELIVLLKKYNTVTLQDSNLDSLDPESSMLVIRLQLNVKSKNGIVSVCILFRSQKAVMGLLEELDVEIYNQWCTGSKIMHGSDDAVTTYSNPLPPLSYLALLDMWWFTYKVP